MNTRVAVLRRDAESFFLAGVRAADPHRAVHDALRGRVAALEDAGGATPVGTILAMGKASQAMARAALECFRGGALRGLVVTNASDGMPLPSLERIVAGHPIPDEAGQRAAERVLALARAHERDRLALVLISGGASALLPAPAGRLSLEDKQETTRALLRAGAPIEALNCVRKHLSYLKGGQLARELSPARVLALVLSDVIGDDFGVIASGPVSPDPGSFADALEVLRSYDVLERAPAAVRAHLEAGLAGEIAETPKPGDPVFDQVEARIVGSNGMSLDAVAEAARGAGYRVEIHSRVLCGEARVAGRSLREAAREGSKTTVPVALLAGGETTVTVRGAGRGGRNQELALAFALACEEDPLPGCWTLLSAGTDGLDGPTDAAGAIVDAASLACAKRNGVDPARALEANDSYRAHDAAGDLLRTGPTGTNVSDIQILLLTPPAANRPPTTPPHPG